MRLRSDVPLAFMMSGGMDSNSIISIASKILNKNVNAHFSSGDKRYAEEEAARRSADDLNINHTIVQVNTNQF